MAKRAASGEPGCARVKPPLGADDGDLSTSATILVIHPGRRIEPEGALDGKAKAGDLFIQAPQIHKIGRLADNPKIPITSVVMAKSSNRSTSSSCSLTYSSCVPATGSLARTEPGARAQDIPPAIPNGVDLSNREHLSGIEEWRFG